MAFYLVTGGAGFIGSHLVKLLLEKGHRVRILDNLSNGTKSAIDDPGNVVEWVVENAERATASAFNGIDGVFHLAGIPSNVLGQSDPLNGQSSGEVAGLYTLKSAASAGVKRVVLASSAAVYGNCPVTPLTEDMPTDPFSFYAAGKVALESYGKMAPGVWKQTDTASLRFFNVYGAGQDINSPYSGVITRFIGCLQKEISPLIYGDGSQTRDFIHVTDVATACLLAMECREKLQGAVFNVGSGSGLSITNLWNILQQAANSSLQPVYAEPRPVDILHSVASVSKARDVLGFQAQVQIENGLKELLQYLSRAR